MEDTKQNMTNCLDKSENLTEYAIHANISKINVYEVIKKFDSTPAKPRYNQSLGNETTGFILVNDTREDMRETMKGIKLVNQRNATMHGNKSGLMMEERKAQHHSFAAPADVEHIPRLQGPDVLVYEKQEIVNINIFGNSM